MNLCNYYARVDKEVDNVEQLNNGKQVMLDIHKLSSECTDNSTNSVSSNIYSRLSVCQNYIEPCKGYMQSCEDFIKPCLDYIEPCLDYIEPCQDYIELTDDQPASNSIEPHDDQVKLIKRGCNKENVDIIKINSIICECQPNETSFSSNIQPTYGDILQPADTAYNAVDDKIHSISGDILEHVDLSHNCTTAIYHSNATARIHSESSSSNIIYAGNKTTKFRCLQLSKYRKVLVCKIGD